LYEGPTAASAYLSDTINHPTDLIEKCAHHGLWPVEITTEK